MKHENVISEIKIGPSLLIAGLSIVVGIVISAYVKNDLGRAAFLSSLMIMLAIYSCRMSLNNYKVIIFVFIYSFAHILFSVTQGEYLEHFSGPLIMLIAMVDYFIFYFCAQIFVKEY